MRELNGSAGWNLETPTEWLRGEGVEISDRGRIPTDLMNRYNAAH